MSKRIIAFLHRHGETSLNVGNVFRARMDPPLDENGLLQAERAAQFLERYDLERIVTSPMLRAWQTAVVTQAAFPHVPIVQDRSLMPWDLGFMAGKDKDLYADLLEFYIENPDKVPPDGESLSAFKWRIEQFFKWEFEHREELTCYICSTSNIVSLNNIINGNDDLKPEIGESVEPGGVVAVVETEKGFEMEPLWGITKEAEYGVS